jgi:hypothetical protein
MKIGQTLPELAAQIKREHESIADFVAPTTQLRYNATGVEGTVAWKVGKTSYEAAPTRHCLRQICERSGIPTKYADKMTGRNLPLLAENVNWWWQHNPEKRMLRTLMNGTQTARAFVSDIYRPLDNYDLAEVILPKLNDIGCEVISSQITETRLYIQAATPRIELDLNKLRREVGGSHTATAYARIKELEPVQAGIVISNSEVGAGSLAIDQMLFFLVCLNGAIAQRMMRRHHVGRRADPLFEELDNAAQYYSDKTKQMDDKVLWNKVRDVTEAMFTKERFESLCRKFAHAGTVKISGTEAVEEITKRFQLPEVEKNSVLNHLIEGGDLSVYGLSAAVTRASTDVDSYDRAIELERIGGEIIELPNNTWSLN